VDRAPGKVRYPLTFGNVQFAATLQAAGGNPHPVLLRVETRAGHGLGKPTSKLIAEFADMLAFLTQTLDISLPESKAPGN